MYFRYKKNVGFTLIELIIVIAIIALVAAGVYISVDPARRIGEARDAERWSDITAIAKAVDRYTADNTTLPSDFDIGTLSTSTKVVLCSGAGTLSCGDDTLACAVIDDGDFLGKYLPQLPVDPSKDDDSDTGYYVTITSGNILSFGACNSYDTTDVPLVTSKSIGWTCGSNLVDPRDDTTYGSVLALDGNCWLDRNLGASQAATAFNDSSAYGDLYQWGRYADGHQVTNSDTTATLSSSDTPGHGDFITIASSPYDWRSPQNGNLWQGVDGTNNPCPNAWRLPTSSEWSAVMSAESISNSATAYSSNLKLVVAGRRSESGAIGVQGSWGYYWSSTISGTNGVSAYVQGGGISSSFGAYRGRGHSVRCIRD